MRTRRRSSALSVTPSVAAQPAALARSAVIALLGLPAVLALSSCGSAAVVASGLAAGGLSSGGSSCGETFRDSSYIPSKSDVVLERDGIEVRIRQVPSKALTIEVTSSDGEFDHTRIDPVVSLYDGLEVTTTMDLGWEFQYDTLDFELEPGQVSTVLRVSDCWTYVSGPNDVF